MARELSQQFKKRTVEKTYLALVRGGAQSFSSKHGQIRSAIQYNDGRASLDPSILGKSSVTDWELACSSVCFTLH
jgi:23S rRNA-/tRNA-specific pseudouridylate synthase